MNSIPNQKRYKKLRNKLQEYDYYPINKSLEEITGRSPCYITGIMTGKKNFTAEEMNLILEALDLEKTENNYLEYFPPLGINKEETIQREAKKWLLDVLQELVNA